MGVFECARTHNLHIRSQTCNPQRHASPWFDFALWDLQLMVSTDCPKLRYIHIPLYYFTYIVYSFDYRIYKIIPYFYADALSEAHYFACFYADALSEAHCFACFYADAMSEAHCFACFYVDALSEAHCFNLRK